MDKKKLTPANIAAIEGALARGDRVELIPVKDGVRMLRVRREEVKKPGERPKNP